MAKQEHEMKKRWKGDMKSIKDMIQEILRMILLGKKYLKEKEEDRKKIK